MAFTKTSSVGKILSIKDLNIDEAFAFCQKYILDQSKHRLLEEYGFKVTGGVPSRDWELFVAILVNDKATPGHGADLTRHEVKSAVSGGAFEYQYHRNTGLQKLEEDIGIEYHVFITYGNNYQDIVVRRVPSKALAPIFSSWKPGLLANYQGDDPRQRYRKNIPYSTVVEHGEVLMEIKDGILVIPNAWPSSSD